jgi:hypothetical protein
MLTPLICLPVCILACIVALDLTNSLLTRSSKSSSFPYKDSLLVTKGHGLSSPYLLQPAKNSEVLISKLFSPQTSAYKNALLIDIGPG